MPYKFNPFTGTFDDTVPLSGGKVPTQYLPSYVDDVEEYANLAAFPTTGETGKIYLAVDTSIIYRWSGSTYVIIGSNVSAINDLSDVSVSNVSTGGSLVWDGTQWVNGPVLGGVTTSTNVAAIIGFNGTSDNTAGSLYPSFTSAQVARNLNYNTTIKRVGSSSLYIPGNTEAGLFYSNQQLRDFLATNDYTFEFWLYTPGGLTAYESIFTIGSSTGTRYIELKNGDPLSLNRLDFRVENSFGIYNSSTDISYNTWNHIAFTHQASNKQCKFFVNGALAGTTTAIATLSSSNTYLHFGAKYNGTLMTIPFGPVYYDNLVITPGLKYTTTFTPTPVEEDLYLPFNINRLEDVDVSTVAPTTNQTLIWNGTNWVPATAVLSRIDGITGASAITNCVTLSQANYDAIVTPDPNTLYVIV